MSSREVGFCFQIADTANSSVFLHVKTVINKDFKIQLIKFIKFEISKTSSFYRLVNNVTDLLVYAIPESISQRSCC